MRKIIAIILAAAMLSLCACGNTRGAGARAGVKSTEDLGFETALTAELLELPEGMAQASAQCRVRDTVWLGGTGRDGAVLGSVSLGSGAGSALVPLPEGCEAVYAMCPVEGGIAVLAGSGPEAFENGRGTVSESAERLWLLRFGETRLVSQAELEKRYDCVFSSMLEMDGSFYILGQNAVVRLDADGRELARFDSGDPSVVMCSMCCFGGNIVAMANRYVPFDTGIFTLDAQALDTVGEADIENKFLCGIGAVGGGLVADTGSGVYALDGDFQLGDPVFEWAELFVDGGYSAIEELGDGYLFFKPGQDQVCCARWRETRVRKTVVIAADASYGEVQTLANDFNRSQDEYFAQVKFYDDNLIMRLQAEIGAGDWPELFAFKRMGTLAETRDELALDNLYDWLDADAELSAEDLMEPVLRAMEQDGALYWVPWKFWVETLIAPEALIPQPGISVEEALRIAGENGLMPVQQQITREEMLAAYSSAAIWQFVDWENRTCSFDSREFARILEFCGGMLAGEDVRAGQYVPYLLTKTFLTDCSDLAMLNALLGEKYCCAGFPEAVGNGSLFYISLRLAITAGAREKDGAWEFIKFILGEEEQSVEIAGSNNGLSMNAAVFERELEALLRDGFTSLLDEDAHIQFTEDDARRFRELVYGVELVESADPTLEKIISDGAAAYFAGDKSAEEAARDIQGRAAIYVAERG